MKRDLQIFLGLQMVAALNAVAAFKLIELRWQAGIVAGSIFVLVGIWMVFKTLKWPQKTKMLSFYTVRVHTWLFALPMLITRLRYIGHDFNEFNFFGVPAAQYHRAAEAVFLMMLVSTIIDWIRVVRWGRLTKN